MKKTLISLLLFASLFGCGNYKQKEIIEQQKPKTELVEGNKKIDKYNLIFIPVNIEDKAYFNQIVDEYLDYEEPINTLESIVCSKDYYCIERGLFTQEPYKSNKDKFNVEIYNNVDLILNSFEEYKKDNSLYEKFDFEENDIPIFVINTNKIKGGTAGIYSGEDIKLFIMQSKDEIEERLKLGIGFNENTLVHELSHYFGLTDEYFLTKTPGTYKKNYTLSFNCVTQEEAEKYWGNLAGQGEGLLKIGYFKGCGRYSDLVKPTQWSIMGGKIEGDIFDNPEILGDRSLGEANIRFLEQKLREEQ